MHDDTGAVLTVLLKIGARANDYLAAAGGVGLSDAASAHDDAAGRKVRAGDMLHQVVYVCVRVFKHAHAGVDDLREIVRRDIRRHADGDAA